MNVRRSLWQGLVGPGQDLKDPQANIRAGSTLLSRISGRLPAPTVSGIATLYNQLSADAVNDFGARVADVYRAKPWLRELEMPMVP
jgi:hypothetical protein